MAPYVSIDDANAALPELAAVLSTLQGQRAELLRLRDLVTAGVPAEPGLPELDPDAAIDRLRLRMQGIADQMAAGALRVDGLGATLRDIATGLVDFPALASGRPIWLCWRLGEPEQIAFWHEFATGVAGRRPLEDLG